MARLRFLPQKRAHAHMLEFSIGDRVAFQPEGCPVLKRLVTRYNKKKVTVITESGERWNVAPSLLPSGNAAVIAVKGNLTPNYCRFEVEGHRRMFRASISVLRPDMGMISALPAR